MTIQEIAQAIVAPGKGILAADESTPTIGKRLAGIGVENTEDNRRAYRELLFTTDNMSEYISGVIMYDETLRQNGSDGSKLVEVLEKQGVFSGIKVDMGVEPLQDGSEEKITNGLDGLEERLKEYYELGARFAKWRAVITIGENMPTDECISKNAKRLAKYAKLVQDAGMVPIVEPEILMDGDHDIDRCYEVTTNTLHSVFEELYAHDVELDGMLLKPNMVIPGKGSGKASSEIIAQKTIDCFHKSVPPKTAGIVFLSGGQSEQEACENLDAMNRLDIEKPWELSFSYGRALQSSVLQAWLGKSENINAAKEAFLKRSKLTSAARSGTYNSDME
ncbi:fructose-bisphosphate aldolase class I [Candidatus Parcubacteria bacterium]|jgi:fructose-bisphosphate aldolase, class I|nr:fructose-bisphosphate aldolase class I [Candidatus Parcubacteria bacterium]MBT3948607.1 fructose-bisphosphate aldolase class I [Candidatus Parcubacteria bacterium]